jgi:hypothetical protein
MGNAKNVKSWGSKRRKNAKNVEMKGGLLDMGKGSESEESVGERLVDVDLQDGERNNTAVL